MAVAARSVPTIRHNEYSGDYQSPPIKEVAVDNRRYKMYSFRT